MRLIATIISVSFVFAGSSQEVPKEQELIENGYGHLAGTYYQSSPEKARKSFLKAKRKFFYKSRTVADARIGLANYFLIKGDTLEAIDQLKKVIGRKNCKLIEQGSLDVFKKDEFDNNWKVYSASVLLIETLISQGKSTLAKEYLSFNTSQVKTEWTCGSGVLSHMNFVNQSKAKLNLNNYFFFLSKGDCSIGNYSGMFTDTTNSIEIDFDSPTITPDSLIYQFDNRRISRDGIGQLDLYLKDTGVFNITAYIYVDGFFTQIDTSINVEQKPSVKIKYRRSQNKKKEDVIFMSIQDSESNDITNEFQCCFTDVQITNSEGVLITNWGCQLSLNVTKLLNDESLNIEKGNIIEISGMRLLKKSINRSFGVVPKIRIVI